MEVRPGYKQTEVGVIPDEWSVSPLKGNITIAHGFPFASEYFASHGSYRLTTPGHFYEEGGFRDIGEKQKHYNGPVPSDYVLQPGDLIVAMTEQADGLLGSAAVIPNVIGYLHNQRLGRVKKLSSAIEMGFLLYVFNSPSYRAKVRETAAGTKVKHTSPQKLLEISVPLPLPSEQRAIAAALSDVDALLAKLDQFIAKKRDLKQAAMQQLLTGQTRLPGFSGEWEIKPFGEVLSRVNGKAFQIQSSDYHETGDHPVVDQGKEPVIGFSDRADKVFNCPSGGVIVFGDHTCIVKFVDFDFVVGADGTQIMAGKNGQSARFHAFQLEYSGIPTTGYNRHFKFVKEREFITPTLAEQTAIATVLSDMDAELVALEARRDKTRALKQGMMQELLTGRIRLV